MLKRIVKSIFVAMVSVLFLLCVLFHIEAMAEKHEYGSFVIDCNISGTTKNGSGSTNGASAGYQNNVLITVYNSSGVSLGNQSACSESYLIASASVSNSAGNIRRIYTLHSVAQNGQQVYPYPDQVKLYKYVN